MGLQITYYFTADLRIFVPLLIDIKSANARIPHLKLFDLKSTLSEKDTLLTLLAAARSKAHINGIVARIGNDAERLQALMDIFLGNDPKMAEYAAWVVGTIGVQQPQLLEPWYPDMVDLLSSHTVHGALKRNTLRIFQDLTIPDTLLDACTDACFKLLGNPFEAIAVRAFSITVLEHICKRVPELWPELRLVLEEHTPHGSAAFRNRASKVLRKMPT